MTNAQLRNLAIFVGVALVNVLVIAVAAGLAAGTMPGFRDGELLAPAKGEAVALLALLAPILSGWIQANRPRFGSENLAAQVNDLRDQGVHRDEMVVLPRDDAAVAVAGELTPAQTKQVADELERRMRAAP